MTGAYTNVPLRRHGRWESAPVQEGRALLDHELNLNPDASIRRDRNLGRDAIGPAGVVEGSSAFQVSTITGFVPNLRIDAGRMWVDGLAAIAPSAFTYSSQDQISPLPASGRALVYLDVWEEHIQPAEDPELIDPAIAPVDTAARTRVGYRIRTVVTTAKSCEKAWAGFDKARLSTGRLSVVRVGPAIPADPCDPPGDAQGLIPDSMLRVEVLDQGSAADARFAWSYENGGAAVSIATIGHNTVTLLPSSSVEFGTDLIEISWLARRADRQNSGGLYTITNVSSLATGDVLTLDRPVTAPPGADGLVARRWDGQVRGAVAPQNATRGGNDLGVRFNAGPGRYRPGDWWGIRVRQADGVQDLVNAEPDGNLHSFAPLALVDFDTGTVLSDCRPTFRPLTDIETGSPCTVLVRPGDSIQAAVDSLPSAGGEICFSAGLFPIATPVLISNRDRVRIAGVGPSSIVQILANETVFRFVESDNVEIVDLAVVAAGTATPFGKSNINGAVTFEGCRGITVRSLDVTVADGPFRTRAAISVRGTSRIRRPERISITNNRLVLGAWQTGILVTDGQDVAIDGNHISLGPAPASFIVEGGLSVFADELTNIFRASIDVLHASRTVRLPTGESIQLFNRSPIGPLVDEWVRIGSPRTGASFRAFREFLRTTTRAGGTNLSASGQRVYARLARDIRSVGQGIVLGGRRVETAHVCHNVVRDAVQGIHVGTSFRGERESIADVLIVGNSTHLRVPGAYARERHSCFVGNVRSVEVAQMRGDVTRTLAPAGLPRTPIDGIRIFGHLGPFVVVRGVSFTGHNVAVRADTLGSPPVQRVWSLRDVMAMGPTFEQGAVANSAFLHDQVAP